jgi:hypothetical protein
MNEFIRLVFCTCCGAKWVESETSPFNVGCNGCGSSIRVMESNIKGEDARLLTNYVCSEAAKINLKLYELSLS